jgi:lysophospholipase L1-like esterase
VQGFPFQRGQSFSQIAGAALAAQGVEIEIINLGVSAVSSYYVREVLREIGRYDPDLVVVYAGHNEYYGSPSMFTGGTHLTRLAILKLHNLRSVQLFETALVRATGRKAAPWETLMAERFAEHLHPLDQKRDEEVADLFVRNLRIGAAPLLRKEIPFLIFEPVSNLVSMPPFRSAPVATSGTGGDTLSAANLYRKELRALEAGGEWERATWEEIRDLDEAPFRARSTLVRRLEGYVAEEPTMRWIPTADRMEEHAGSQAFTDAYFIDHLHFNFEGQILLGSILAEAIAETLLPDRPEVASALPEYFADTRQIREAVYLTNFWEFAAYSKVVALHQEEPFRSMPIPKANPLTEDRVRANPLYSDSTLLSIYRGSPAGEDLFHTTLEYYYRSGNREEWIRNMNAYVHLFPGDFGSHLAYGIALLTDDPGGNLDMAASYFRQAYLVSQRREDVRYTIESEFSRMGIAHLWPAFEIQYLR